MENQQTIGEAYRKASDYLGDSFEAELLLRKLLGFDRTAFYLAMQQSFPMEKQQILQEWLMRRAAHEPIQYITEEQPFYGRRFLVNPSVLIPRPETEILVEKVIQTADHIFGKQPLHVADLGTGSGAIAITLAAERPDWHITAVDYSTAALQTAIKNAARHGVENRIRFEQGDFLTPLIDSQETVDVVVSNPPYITQDEMKTIEAQVRDFEPTLALVGGKDGLDAYRKILMQLRISNLRAEKYIIAFEIGATQGEAVQSLLQSFNDDLMIEVLPDLAGYDRVVLAYEKRYQK